MHRWMAKALCWTLLVLLFGALPPVTEASAVGWTTWWSGSTTDYLYRTNFPTARPISVRVYYPSGEDTWETTFSGNSFSAGDGMWELYISGSVFDYWEEDPRWWFNRIDVLLPESAGAPGVPEVPAASDTDSYTVSWGASPTAGATYVLQEATNAAFTQNLRTAYSGTATSTSLTGRVAGVTYHYRVKAIASNHTDSAWATGGNGCTVNPDLAQCLYEDFWDPAPRFYLESGCDYAITWNNVPIGSGLSGGITDGAGMMYWEIGGYRYTQGGSWSVEEWDEGCGDIYTAMVCRSPAGVPSPNSRPAPVATLAVPPADNDGSYSISWSASATSGATYVLEEATSADFTTGLRTAYTGTAKSAAITGRGSATYYYRVKARRTGLEDSVWRVGVNGCEVVLPPAGTPASITVPATDNAGNYAVSWGASATSGVSYVLEEATDSGFTTNLRTAYSGAGTATTIIGRSGGATYYYRVRATKSGIPDSAWRSGGNGCTVILPPPAPPGPITVPAIDYDGAFTASWGASTTPGVTYVLEESKDGGGFAPVPIGAGLSANLAGRANGSYQYRVKAIKSGSADSNWVISSACTVIIDTVAPTITVHNGGTPFAGGRVADVRHLRITAVDGIDPSPAVQSAKIVDRASGAAYPLTLAKSGSTSDVTGPVSLNGLELPEADLVVTARDAAGNTREVKIGLAIDSKPPRISILDNGQPYATRKVLALGDLAARLEDGSPGPRATRVFLTDQETGVQTEVPFVLDGQEVRLMEVAGLDLAAIGAADLTVQAEDSFANPSAATVTFINDDVGPTITLAGGAGEFSGGRLASLADLTVELFDSHDPAPNLLAVTAHDLKSGATATLGWESAGPNGYRLRAPGGAAFDPPGEIRLTVKAVDRFGNPAQRIAEIDNTPPAVAFRKAGAPFDGSLDAFDVFSIKVTDLLDAAPAITSIRLTGGPEQLDQPLAWLPQGDGFAVVPPTIFPNPPETPYALAVSATDKHGNTKTQTATFDFVVRSVSFTDGSTLTLPAVPHAFTRPDGKPALVSNTLKDRGNQVIRGKHDLYAALKSGSQVPLVINGVQVNPGQQQVLVASGYDLDATQGRIELSLKPAQEGLAGTSDLIVQSLDPAAPIVSGKVKAWTLEAALSAANWSPQRLLDVFTVQVKNQNSAPCTLTTELEGARTANVFSKPVAYVEFEQTLPEMAKTMANPPTIAGRLTEEGEQNLAFSAYLFDNGTGQKVRIGGGTRAVTVAPPPEISFVPTPDVSEVIRVLQKVSFGMKQAKGPALTVTTSEAEAAEATKAGRFVGLFEWTEIPEGLAQEAGTNSPQLKGRIEQPGNRNLGWRVSYLDKTGARQVLLSQNQEIRVKDPVAPEITLQSQLEVLPDGALAASVDGGQIGLATVTVPRQAGNVTLEIAGVKGGSLSAQYATGSALGGGETTSFARFVDLGPDVLWQRTRVDLVAYYTDLPDVRTERSVEIMRVPPARIYLALLPAGEGLDITGLPLTVKVGEMISSTEMAYDPTRFGQWKLEIGQVQKNAYTPIEKDLPLLDGVYEGMLENQEAGYYSLQAKATITSPDGNFSREISSNRQFVGIFRGAAPQASIVSRYFTGRAPFLVALSLDMDRESRAVLGETVWEYSSDEGASWQTFQETSPYRLLTSFQAGKYRVRARVTNLKSNEVGYADTVGIHAFHIPELRLEGSSTVFTGATARVRAITTREDSPVPAVVEWRDFQKNVLQTGSEFSMVPEEQMSICLTAFARLTDSPAEDPTAWEKKRHCIQAKPVAPPRGQLALPTYMESDQAYPIKARVSLPYWGMDAQEYPLAGEWTLPDGRAVPGTEIAYTPTDADAAAGTVVFKYTAWIEGFKEKGALASIERRVRVGRYVWPAFEIIQSQAIQQAPSTVTLQLNPVDYKGRLENPTYRWLLPASAEIIRDYGSRIVVRFAEPGLFDVSAQVADGRGSTAEAVTQVLTTEPTPFEIAATLTPSNKWFHAPVNLTVWARSTGGHPQDRMTEFKFFMNEAPVETTTNVPTIRDLQPGVHTLRIEGSSLLGQTATAEIPVEVFENAPPTCEVANSLLERAVNPLYLLEAKCADSDGYLVSYRWNMDGKQISTSYKVGVPVPEPGTVKDVSLTVSDNSGGSYSATVTLSP